MFKYIILCWLKYWCIPQLKKKLLLSAEELMLWNCGAGEDSWESHGQQEDQASKS